MTSAQPITVLLAEDHAIVREGICALLKEEGRFLVVGQARTGREAVKLAKNLRPDIILMDIAMPMLNGLEATKRILAANSAAKIVILSAHRDDIYIDRSRAAGVAGFLEKQTSAEMLIEAICEVAKGHLFFSPSLPQGMSDDRNKPRNRDGLLNPNGIRLTSRETEVLKLVAEGLANKQAAGQLGISIKTVEKHRQHLMDKLNIHDIAGLTRYAIAAGVIKGDVQLTIV